VQIEKEIYLYIGIALVLIAILALIYWRRRRRSRSGVSPMTLGLEKTHDQFMGRLKELVSSATRIDDAVCSQLEELLLTADVGVKTTQKLLRQLREDITSSGRNDIQLLKSYLSQEILKILQAASGQPTPEVKPLVVMMVGVNGVGKTTTIGKLAFLLKRQGKEVLLAAADTFRAGAINQLKAWGERVGITTLAQQEGADPAAVCFDAVQSALSKHADCVLIDTAGRLHTKANLMEELKKVHRVIAKAMPGAPHEVWLVVDATQGQNALMQAREFHQALGLTGIILTKLDGTAKGGIVVAISDEIGVPIRYVGVGERLEDLQPFFAQDFVDALLA